MSENRRSRKKSRNGCARCKGQRLKCDEEKPACGRCVRVGVQCPGYAQSLRWSTKYEVFKPQWHEATGNEQAASNEFRVPSPAKSSPVFSFDDALGWQSHFNPELDTTDFQLSDANAVAQFCDFFSDTNEAQYISTQSPGFDFFVPLLGSERRDSRVAESRPSPMTVADAEDSQEVVQSQLVRSVTQTKKSCLPSVLSEATPPRAAAWPVPQSLNDESSILVEFYFKETAVVFSCYDSPLNPFRTTVSALWENSPVMYYTLQSMAAASLTDSFPQLASMGPQLRKKAIALLEKEDDYDHKSLLALLMLGGTASWHDPRDLGLTFFNTARRRLETMSSSGNNNARFFEEALIYWEMLLSFVTDNNDLMPLKDGAYTKEYNPSRKVPHPWTGIARDCQYAVQEVGRLIRHERKLAHARNFATHARIKQLRQAMARAGELEEYLLALAHPVESDVVNPEDNETPVWHLLNLAEIYRRTGLIQLYHVFPDLLQRRLPHDERTNTETRGDNTAGPSPGSDNNMSPFVHCDWLTSFALQTLELLKSIPLESGTRDFQPFLLVALCSQPRIPRPETTSNAGPSLASTTTTTPSGVFPSGTVPEVSVRSIQVSRMRKVLLGRLTALLHVLPPKPIQLCLNIVKETWSQMDTAAQSGASEADDVYWMDVMIANGWETTMA